MGKESTLEGLEKGKGTTFRVEETPEQELGAFVFSPKDFHTYSLSMVQRVFGRDGQP